MQPGSTWPEPQEPSPPPTSSLDSVVANIPQTAVPSVSLPLDDPTPVAVEMVVRQETWIRVLADESQPIEEVLQPGATRRFTAQDSLDLTIGNAGGITLRINDREIRPLGRPGQVKTIVITPENVQQIDQIIG